MLKILVTFKENVSCFLVEWLHDEHIVYVYMVIVLYLVRIKANLQVNYISYQDNTEGSRAHGSGPADCIIVSVGTHCPSEKVTIWHILTFLSFINDKFHTCKGIYSDILRCYALDVVGNRA